MFIFTELFIADFNQNPSTKMDLINGSLQELGRTGIFWNNRDTFLANSVIPNIPETIPCAFIGNSDQLIRTKVKYDLIRQQIIRWNTDKLRQVSFWLYHRANNETALRRDLIVNIDWLPSGTNDSYAIDRFLQGNLIITRRGVWETLPVNTVTKENIPTCGGTIEIPSGGTVNGRVVELSVNTPALGANPFILNEYWFGFKPTYSGSNDLNPIIPFSAGRRENGLDPSGFLSMGTTDILRRYSVSIGEIISGGQSPQNYVGRYTVLLKQAPSNTDVIYILRYGNLDNTTEKITNNRVYVNSTNMHFINLGEFVVPANINRNFAISDIRRTELEIFIGNTSGAADVQFGEIPIVLMPTDHFMYINGENLNNVSNTFLEYNTHEDDAVSYELSSPTGELITGNPEIRNFYAPFDSSLLVFAAQRNTVADNTGTDLSTIGVDLISRYSSYVDRTFKPISAEC